MNTSRITSLLAASLLATSPAFAASVTVPNFSFETPDIFDNGGGAGAYGQAFFPNWTIGPTASMVEYIVMDPSPGYFASAFGDNGPLPGTADGGQMGVIRLLPSAVQGTFGTLTSGGLITLQANTAYTLTVAIGDDLISTQESESVQIRLLVNGSLVTQSSTSGAALSEGTFTDLLASFSTLPSGDPLVGGSLQIQLVHTKLSPGTGTDSFAEFDNVRLDATVVPEPASVFLLLAGAACCFRRTRRQPLNA